MKNASLIATAALVLLANALTLIHVARNRYGTPDAEITLTERELRYWRNTDDSGVDLLLLSEQIYDDANSKPWLNEQKLRELGFNCAVAASDPNAASFYRRQNPRRGFVALEYNGTGWQNWLRGQTGIYNEAQRLARQRFDNDASSQLVGIDVARDATVLRARYPDRNRVIILPAIIRITLSGLALVDGRAERPNLLTGLMEQVPSKIHVPLPFANGFRALPDGARWQNVNRTKPGYRVHVRYGRLLEPWITAVEFSDK